MKRIFFIFFFFITLTLGTKAWAQTELVKRAETTVRATARVMENLQMLTIRNLDLIRPPVEDNKINVSPITNEFAGMFKILGTPSTRVRVTFLQNEELKEQEDGFGSVSARYFVSVALEDTQFQSTLLDFGEANIRLSENGELYLWLGAELDLSMATPGMYLSEFIIELEYIL